MSLFLKIRSVIRREILRDRDWKPKDIDTEASCITFVPAEVTNTRDLLGFTSLLGRRELVYRLV